MIETTYTCDMCKVSFKCSEHETPANFSAIRIHSFSSWDSEVNFLVCSKCCSKVLEVLGDPPDEEEGAPTE